MRNARFPLVGLATLFAFGCGRVNDLKEPTPTLDVGGETAAEDAASDAVRDTGYRPDGCRTDSVCYGGIPCSEAELGKSCWYDTCLRENQLIECVCARSTDFNPKNPYVWGLGKVQSCPKDAGTDAGLGGG